jgi:AraC-like DNA-binding protein
MAYLPDPRRETSIEWDADCPHMGLRVDDDVLHRELESMLGYSVDAPIHFKLGMQLASGPARSWRAAVGLLAAEIHRDSGLLESPLVTSRLESFILASLLTAQPHNYTSALRADQRPAPSRAVRHAMECIEEHPAQALTTARLAASAGVSARALQRGFREQVGCSPMTYLRTVRLKRARDALAAADAASGLTVTNVALEWGFMHLGRFSAEYRRHFGQTPSQTLRR